MKNITKLFAIALVVIGSASTSFAQVSATAVTNATIITPIAITKTADLDFGNVAVSPTIAGTVVLIPAGTRTAGGGVTLPTVGGTVSAAKFTVTGVANSTYSISLPVSISLVNGGNTMTVNAFTSTPTPTGLLTLGTQEILVGATLNVAAAQAAGLYTNAADLKVTVNYN